MSGNIYETSSLLILQALITFLYVDFLDATGTLFSMVRTIWKRHIRPYAVPAFLTQQAL